MEQITIKINIATCASNSMTGIIARKFLDQSIDLSKREKRAIDINVEVDVDGNINSAMMADFLKDVYSLHERFPNVKFAPTEKKS